MTLRSSIRDQAAFVGVGEMSYGAGFHASARMADIWNEEDLIVSGTIGSARRDRSNEVSWFRVAAAPSVCRMIASAGEMRGTPEQPDGGGREGSGPDERISVLVVEDDEMVLEVAVESLELLGYRTLSAPDAAAALAVLQSDERIDVLFSDVVMPGAMNGVGLAKRARILRPGLRILLTSGYVGSNRSELPRDVPLLAKPYVMTELAERIRHLTSD